MSTPSLEWWDRWVELTEALEQYYGTDDDLRGQVAQIRYQRRMGLPDAEADRRMREVRSKRMKKSAQMRKIKDQMRQEFPDEVHF